MATLKAKKLAKEAAKAVGAPQFKFDKKNIITSVIGGALLFYAYKKRSSTLGRLASVAGTSLLGRGLSGSAGII